MALWSESSSNLMTDLNPYQPTTPGSLSRPRRRGVTGYCIVFCLGMTLGVLVSIPGWVLLDQEWNLLPRTQTMPRTSYYHEFEFNGQPVSNRTVIVQSLTAGAIFTVVGMISGGIALRNRRHNRRLHLGCA